MEERGTAKGKDQGPCIRAGAEGFIPCAVPAGHRHRAPSDSSDKAPGAAARTSGENVAAGERRMSLSALKSAEFKSY